MTISYWKKVKHLDIKYNSSYKLPMLVYEILTDITIIYEIKYITNFNHYVKINKENGINKWNNKVQRLYRM